MVSRYCGVLLASVALAITSFGTGAYVVATHGEDRPDPPAYLADGAAPGKTPCIDTAGANESALCSQWRSTLASEDSAFWAMWSVVLALAGMIGLFWTLIYTRRAVVAAEEAEADTRTALEIAERTAAAAARSAEVAASQIQHLQTIDRAWVHFLYLKPWRVSEVGKIVAYQFGIRWKNSGRSPAFVSSMFTTHKFTDTITPDVWAFIDGEMFDRAPGIVAQGGEVSTQRIQVPLADILAVCEEKKHLFIYAFVHYRDAVGVHGYSEVMAQVIPRVPTDAIITGAQAGMEIADMFQIIPVGPWNRVI